MPCREIGYSIFSWLSKKRERRREKEREGERRERLEEEGREGEKNERRGDCSHLFRRETRETGQIEKEALLASAEGGMWAGLIS